MKISAIILYIISGLFLIVYGIAELIPDFMLSEFGRLFLLCGSCFFLYFGGLLLSKYRKDNKAMKINLWIFFGLYLILLMTLILFDPMWGRNGISFINIFNDNFKVYIKESVNLIPFKTIITYIQQFDSLYSTKQILLNLLGNLAAFMPMAFFLPLLFDKQNKLRNFLITITILILGTEVIQLLTTSGRFDIDDYILNITGATLMFFYLKNKSISKLIKNIFLLEHNKMLKKDVKFILYSMLTIVIVVGGIIIYRNNLYNKNYENYINTHNPQIVLIDKSTNCVEEKDLFYEDELYKYYFLCKKSDEFYIKVNNKEEFLLKDILANNDTSYHITIDRIIDIMDYFKYEYKIENKYNSINFKIDKTKEIVNNEGSYTTPNIKTYIEDENVVKVKPGAWKTVDKIMLNFDLFLIPQNSGLTTLNVMIKSDETNKIIIDKKYEIIVDKDLGVEYERIS